MVFTTGPRFARKISMADGEKMEAEEKGEPLKKLMEELKILSDA